MDLFIKVNVVTRSIYYIEAHGFLIDSILGIKISSLYSALIIKQVQIPFS